MFMRESHTNTNDFKRLGCLNVIAKIKTNFYGPMEEKENSFQAEWNSEGSIGFKS